MGSDDTAKHKRSGTGRPILIALVFAGAVGLSYFGSAAVLNRGDSSSETPDDGTAAAVGGRKAALKATAKAAKVGGKDMSPVQKIMETRVCGRPAVDGYAHVVPSCLEESPTNKWWQENKPQPDDLDIHIERHADYDGLAVGWGIGNTKGSIEECAEACRQHKPKGPSDGPFGNLPCNAFAWCAFDNCFEPDAHKHGKGDCWLKFTEGPASPEVNMRGRLSLAAQKRHPQAPKEVQWHAGVLLPHGVTLTNGSWSPRHDW
ncbi:hypothetical protein CHLNCDRAFT_134029 [Chlorella variabilis]|uniref:Apple domain-containing protein n=1 Tax=Chlorella variabilis TaxID=554065 RepID=E1ZEU2_CHLVA|nr:hypothetical protein CHLNCDRAFT_134029 [Chlorella variabilis]EFN55718.1 hypothetical protein CHLNCDRAFT_134029 [Chlorella variabilis]|eukprot:XP_005847820.1 hypothetical protein CHLNCDRAFT_134029 [Chlorella variabilis]